MTTIRDTYTTSACDVCEQLKKDLAPLESFSKKKGYDSDKMRDTVDMLYQRKTQEKDFHKIWMAYRYAGTTQTNFVVTKR